MDITTILEKVEATLNIVLPVVVMILTALGLTNIVPEVQLWEGIVLEVLATASIVIKIWLGQTYKKALKALKSQS
jgi:chromate transport protein ChrA